MLINSVLLKLNRAGLLLFDLLAPRARLGSILNTHTRTHRDRQQIQIVSIYVATPSASAAASATAAVALGWVS